MGIAEDAARVAAIRIHHGNSIQKVIRRHESQGTDSTACGQAVDEVAVESVAFDRSASCLIRSDPNLLLTSRDGEDRRLQILTCKRRIAPADQFDPSDETHILKNPGIQKMDAQLEAARSGAAAAKADGDRDIQKAFEVDNPLP